MTRGIKGPGSNELLVRGGAASSAESSSSATSPERVALKSQSGAGNREALFKAVNHEPTASTNVSASAKRALAAFAEGSMYDQSEATQTSEKSVTDSTSKRQKTSTEPVPSRSVAQSAMGLIAAEVKQNKAQAQVGAVTKQAASKPPVSGTAINRFEPQAGFEKVIQRLGAEPNERARNAHLLALSQNAPVFKGNDFLFRFQNPAREGGNLGVRAAGGLTRFIAPLDRLAQTQNDVDTALGSYGGKIGSFKPLWLQGDGAFDYANVLMHKSNRLVLSQPGLNEDPVCVTLILNSALRSDVSEALVHPSYEAMKENTVGNHPFSAAIVGVNSAIDPAGFLYTTSQELKEAFGQKRPALLVDLNGDEKLLTHGNFEFADFKALNDLGPVAARPDSEEPSENIVGNLTLLTTRASLTPDQRAALVQLTVLIHKEQSRIEGLTRNLGDQFTPNQTISRKKDERREALVNALVAVNGRSLPKGKRVEAVKRAAISYSAVLKKFDAPEGNSKNGDSSG